MEHHQPSNAEWADQHRDALAAHHSHEDVLQALMGWSDLATAQNDIRRPGTATADALHHVHHVHQLHHRALVSHAPVIPLRDMMGGCSKPSVSRSSPN